LSPDFRFAKLSIFLTRAIGVGTHGAPSNAIIVGGSISAKIPNSIQIIGSLYMVYINGRSTIYRIFFENFIWSHSDDLKCI